MTENVASLRSVKVATPPCAAKAAIPCGLAVRKQHEMLFAASKFDINKSEFVERFPELSLFYRLFSPLNSEMICIFPYFCPYAESAREIREIF